MSEHLSINMEQNKKRERSLRLYLMITVFI